MAKKEKFPIKGGQWVPYIFGWLWVTSWLWWVIMLIIYGVKKDKKFFGPQFHRRVMVSGWIMIPIFAIFFVIGFLS
jgi:hypothetical protein